MPRRGTDAVSMLQAIDRLADIEDILGDEYDLEKLKELAQAALKLRRVIDGTNPTPVSEEEAKAAIIEELSDVALCCKLLNIRTSHYTMQNKLNRWRKRLEERNREQKDFV